MSLKIISQPEAAPLNHRLINPITLLNTVLTSLTGISAVVCVHACAQLHLTLCVPWHCSPPGSSVHGISQVRLLEQVAISYSKGPSWPRDLTHISWVSYIGRQILYHHTTWEAQIYCIFGYNMFMKVNDEYCIKVCSFPPVKIIGKKQPRFLKSRSTFITRIGGTLFLL